MAENRKAESISQGAKEAQNASKAVAKQTGKAAKGAAKKAMRLIPFKIKLIIVAALLFLLIILIVVGGTSESQMTATYYLTAQDEDNGMNRPKKEDADDAIWKKDTAIEQSDKLLAVINKEKENNREAQRSTISSFCASNGYDAEESLAHLQQSASVSFAPVNTETTSEKNGETKSPSKKENNKKGDSGKVLQDFSLTGVTPSQLSKFSFEYIDRNWNPGTVQRKIYDSGNWYADEYGLCKYRNKDGTEDYMVALGSYFGATGNRYRITFRNGTSATFLKADAKANEHTLNGKGIVGLNGGLLEFIVDHDKLNGTILHEGDISAHPKKIFDQIAKIELIEGTLSSNIVSAVASSDLEVLSAYSVALSNVELTKVDGLFGGFFEHVGEKYVNEKGFEVSVVWFGSKAGQIDYENDLQKRIRKFIRNGGSFYNVDYEREKGHIKVYTKTIEVQPGSTEKTPGTNKQYEVEKKTSSKKESGEDKGTQSTTTIQYVVPILTEKPISDIMYELFELDPDETYVNDDGTNIKNSEVIYSLAETTSQLLYDGSYGGSAAGGINISELSGKFAWPTPGVYYITSLFGNRYHPVYHEYRYHGGIDIGTPMKTPIVACEDGVVTVAGVYGGYGYAVQIQHENGVSSLYGHLDSINVRVGQKVSKGQQIALSGNSGISTGPHLHFTITVNGQSTDPTTYVLTPESYKSVTIAPDA